MFSLERLQRFLLALCLFGFSMYALRRGLTGRYFWLHAGTLLLGIGVVVFWLKDRYWLLMPIALISGLSVIEFAGRRIRLSELTIILSALIFLARMALLRIPFRIELSKTWPVFLHFIWVAAIFAINPVGLAITGSQAIGGRFYLVIFLGAVSTALLATQKVSEKDAKKIIFFAILLSFVFPVLNYFRFRTASAITDPEHFYTWHQSLTRPATILLYYVLAKYRRVTLHFTVLFVCTLGLVMLSGKRAIFMVTAVLPIIAALVLNRSIMQAIVRFASMLALLTVLILLHGSLVTLPRLAQRSMALLPGRWDPSLERLQSDMFRNELRKLAWLEIKDAPLMGRKGYTINRNEVIYRQSSGAARRDPFEGHAYSANWHSAWLAFWVDFGLPAVLTYAAFIIMCITFGYRLFQTAEDKSYRQILTGILLLMIISRLITSFTGGHSALTVFNEWWILGLMVAIHRGVREEKKLLESEIEETNTAPEFSGNETQPKPSIPPKHIPKLAYPATNS